MKRKISFVLICTLAISLAGCGKNNEETSKEEKDPNVTVQVTNIDTTPPVNEATGGPSGGTSFDDTVKQMSGRGTASENAVLNTSLVDNKYSSDNRCDQIVVDGIVFDYGISVAEFNNLMKASPHADEYVYGIKPDQLVVCNPNKPTECLVYVQKGGELYFTAVFTYPPYSEDAVSIGKTCLAEIRPEAAALENVSWGKGLSYKDLKKVTYNNFEEFLWQNVVAHEAGWEALPKVTLENGEMYEARGEGFHYHTYMKETEGEDGSIVTEKVREEEPCDIKDGKCTLCGYEVPDVKYESSADSWSNTITINYTHSGKDLYVQRSSQCEFALFVPNEYDVELKFSTDTRELIDFKLTAKWDASWDIPVQ